MSLGAGAWRVSGWPDATNREEVSMATLEAGTTPKAATNPHCHTEKRKFQWRYLPVRIPTWKLHKKPPAKRQGGRRGSENPQRFAKKEQLIRYDQQAKQQCSITLATNPQRDPATPQRGIGDNHGLIRSSLTSPKLHLATLKISSAYCCPTQSANWE